ncbi:MAG: hypothetical protein DWI22_06490 [Planctomycetota bacterium]|nr:MAG: hypothetical protein DWI22_06490 [Planctomycetota bacterium]
MPHFRRLTFVCCLFGLFLGPKLRAGDVTASQLLPDTTIGYVEVTDTAAIMANLYDHPVSHHIQNLEAWKAATQTAQYRGLLTGRKFVEIQLGTDWRFAVEALTVGGIYAAFDSTTQGAAILVKTRDDATAENFRMKILELTLLNEQKYGKTDPYRDVTVYQIDQHTSAAVVRNWIILTNKGPLGKGILDRLLDEKPADANTQIASTLSANLQFRTSYATRKVDSQGWAYGSIQAIRDAGAAQNFFESKTENPLAEALVGGIQSVLQHAPFVTADFSLTNSGLTMQIATPWDDAWIPEERDYFFGPESKGSAPVLPEIPGTLLTLSTYRNISQMWLRAGDLFDEQTNDNLAEVESGLSTIFAGRDFGEDILGALDPQIGLIVTRQSFENVKPVPTVKLPAFALILKLRDAETMRSELRRTFQSVIGFFNIIGAMDGRPQLEMDMAKVNGFDLITAHYVPERKDKDSTTADLIFNFSPSAAFSGDQFILASSADLVKKLVNTSAARTSESGVNTQLALQAEAIRDALSDNREQLISQNMLQQGHSRDEAVVAIDLMLEVVRCVKGAGITLRHEENSLALQLHVTVNENP